MNIINSDINCCVRTENTQMFTVEKYSFLVAYSKKVYLSGLHMSQQYSVDNREEEEERGKDRKERRRKRVRCSLEGHINRSFRCRAREKQYSQTSH